MDLAPGTILLGKYRVIDVIGTGGMGRVVRATHMYLHQTFAIKVLLPHMAESASTVERFLREAQSTSKLKSEHITRVIDVATLPEGVPCIVMEYLEGNDLNQILRHHGPQEPAIVCDLMLQACEGIAEAHAAGIVHRDIKPSNFFITQRTDGSMLLKILDFGISKTPVGFEELTGTQTVIGTPSYMAPEQMKSGRFADARSDIWSMGVVMYQLLQGRPPFSGESYAELVLKVGTEQPAPLMVPLPQGLRDLILKCLEKDPRNRHQNVGELARMLAPFASDPITAAQIATRTTRILQARPSQSGMGGTYGQQVSPLSAGGGLAAPVPLSPAQLTPRSWPPSTSTSHGRGQVTHKTRGGKGWLVAGAISLVILAGAGGFIANELMKDDAPRHEGAVVEAPPPRPANATAATPTEGSAAGSADGATGSGAGSAATTTATATASPTPTAGSGSGEGSAQPASAHTPAPSPWKPTVPQPTIVTPTTATKPADTQVATTATDPKPAKDPKPATDTKTTAAVKPTPTTTKATTTKSSTTKATTTKSSTTKSTSTKSTATKSTGTKKKNADLFDRRD